MIEGNADARRAYVTSLRLLGRRELSTLQIRQRLQKRGFSAEAVDVAVSRLVAEGALDDRRTARALVRTELLVKRRGPLRVRRQLQALGIAADLIEEALRDTFESVDQQTLLEQAVARRIKPTGPRVLDAASFRRVYAQLVRQGFSSSAVIAALKARGGAQNAAPDDET